MTEIIYNGYDLDNLNIQYGLGMNPYLEDGSLKTMQHRPLEMQNAAREINSFSKSNIKNIITIICFVNSGIINLQASSEAPIPWIKNNPGPFPTFVK